MVSESDRYYQTHHLARISEMCARKVEIVNNL